MAASWKGEYENGTIDAAFYEEIRFLFRIETIWNKILLTAYQYAELSVKGVCH